MSIVRLSSVLCNLSELNDGKYLLVKIARLDPTNIALPTVGETEVS